MKRTIFLFSVLLFSLVLPPEAGSQRRKARRQTQPKPPPSKPLPTPTPIPVPDTPEVILARTKQACAAGDFKACLQLHESVKKNPELISSAKVPPDSVPIQAASPELVPGMTWTYRLLSVDGAFDNKLLEVMLMHRDAKTTKFRLRLDGKDEETQIEHQGAKYFSPRAEKAGKITVVPESVLPDVCRKDTGWSASGSRRGIIQGGQIVGWVQTSPSMSAHGPVLHNIPGGLSPAAVVWKGAARMIIAPGSAFVAQVLTVTPDGARILFNLVSMKQADGKEHTALPAIDSAAWSKLIVGLKENAIPGDFERETVFRLVDHVNEHPDMQFVMIGGSQLSKSGKGVCVLWGHNGIVAESCDAQSFNVEPNKSISFVVP